MMLGALAAAAVFIVLYPAFVPAKPAVQHRSCLEQIKQVGLAMIMYDADEDGLPPRDYWVDLSYPYTKSWDVFHCPVAAGRWGYAFNGGLEGKNIEKMPPTVMATTPMAYDSVNPTKNASDLVKSLPAKPRHTKNSVAYADGHAKPR